MSRLAYVLPEAAVSGTDAVNLAGFPGIWIPGQPIAASELARHGGFADEDEVAARIEDLGLPLEQVEVSGDEGKMPVAENHGLNSAEAVEQAIAEIPRPTTHKQADKLARDRDFAFSSPDMKLDEKVAELFGDVAHDATTPETPFDEPPTEPPTEDDE